MARWQVGELSVENWRWARCRASGACRWPNAAGSGAPTREEGGVCSAPGGGRARGAQGDRPAGRRAQARRVQGARQLGMLGSGGVRRKGERGGEKTVTLL